MTDHANTSEHSRKLCDLIVERLRVKAEVPVKHGKNMCSVGSGPVFLYVFHQKNGLKIYIYCSIGDLENLRSVTNNSINIETRKSLGNDWAKITPYFVKINSQAEAELIPSIYEYLASKPRHIERARKESMFVPPSEDGICSIEEGDKISMIVNKYERAPKNRSACIKIHGAICQVCGFDFAKKYGDIGNGFIHVHHLTPLSSAGRKHKINPKDDLCPVCPNCHEMLHKRTPPFSINEMRNFIQTRDQQ